MKLENQVVNLELSKRMKELGFEQESLFYWKEIIDNHPHAEPFLFQTYLEENKKDKKGCYNKDKNDKWKEKVYSAYTVAELGEMLPKWYASWRDVDDYQEDGIQYGHTYVCGREDKIKSGEEEFMVALTEADARAKCLIYLKVQKLI